MENFKEVKREELKKWLDEKKDFVLIDVLSQGSYEGRHLPGALHAGVHEDGFLEKVSQLMPDDKDKTVVVYCSSFTCQASPTAAGALVKAGYTDVYDFKGGLADWQDAKYPFEEEVTAEKVESKCSCCN